MLIDTVTEIFREINAKFKESAKQLQDAHGAVGHAGLNLHQAQEQESCLARQAEMINIKQKELIDYCNGLLEKPQAFLDKISSLAEQHAEALKKCQKAKAIVQCQQAELDRAEVMLDMADAEHMTLQQKLQEVTEHMQRIGKGS